MSEYRLDDPTEEEVQALVDTVIEKDKRIAELEKEVAEGKDSLHEIRIAAKTESNDLLKVIFKETDKVSR